MRLVICLVLLAAILPAAALAGVDGSDFDSMPAGPYPFPGQVLEGNPGNVQVRPVQNGTQHGAPLPSDASGNMLCVDAVQKTDRIVLEFTFSCDPATEGVCEVSYEFSTAQWADGGVEVFVDAGGDYSNPDDVVDLPVGIPPSTSFGGNTETEGACDTSVHTLTFIVYPGTILYLEDMATQCLIPTPVDEPTWGSLKVRYR